MLLIFPEVFLQVVDVLKNFFQDVVEALSALMLKGSAFGSKELRVFFVVVQTFYSFLDVSLLFK